MKSDECAGAVVRDAGHRRGRVGCPVGCPLAVREVATSVVHLEEPGCHGVGAEPRDFAGARDRGARPSDIGQMRIIDLIESCQTPRTVTAGNDRRRPDRDEAKMRPGETFRTSRFFRTSGSRRAPR